MDRFRNSSDSVSSPARSVRAIEPGADPLSEIPKALYVGTGGDLELRAADDDVPVVLRNVASGTVLPVRVAQIYPSGTDAADLAGLY